MEHDTLARVLSTIRNAESRGEAEIKIMSASRVIKQVLEILKKEDYIKDYEVSEGKKNILHVKLSGAINNIGTIKPRYPITLADYERYESRYLPAKDFGRLIISTPKGVMTHIEAKEKRLGGVLLAFVY